MTTPDIVAALEAIGATPKQHNGYIMARCPVHDDNDRSLSIREGDTSPLLTCHACKDSMTPADYAAAFFRAIKGGTQLAPAQSKANPRGRGSRGNPDHTYTYTDADGNVLARRYRWDKPKQIEWAKGTVTADLPLYRLADLNGSGEVYLCEGEKAVELALERGLSATCAPNVRETDLSPLRGRFVRVVVDNDETGREKARTLLLRLWAEGIDAEGVAPAVKDLHADLWDHLTAGFSTDTLKVIGTKPRTTTLTQVHDTFRHWMSEEFDLGVVDAVLAVAASGLHLPDDPAWLLVVGAPSSGKTETLNTLADSGVLVRSTIESQATLLSASPQAERTDKSTGGLLRELGDNGVLALKDFTTILSMRREERAEVLAALREVYDGKWSRTKAVDGGRVFSWAGRLTLLGGVTQAYDAHSSVIASMGDRFLLLRMEQNTDAVRAHVTKQMFRSPDGDAAMREQLTAAVTGLLANLSPPAELAPLPDEVIEQLSGLANAVTKARTSVATDRNGNPETADDWESPYRFAKQLRQLWRGACLIGMGEAEAMELTRRVALDSMPRLRRAALVDLAANPESTARDVCQRLKVSKSTADRTLQALFMLGLLVKGERVTVGGKVWTYTLADAVGLAALTTAADVYGGGPDAHSVRQTPLLRGREGEGNTSDVVLREEPPASSSARGVR